MSDIRDTALLRSKAGNLELIPMQVEDADSTEPMALKGRDGALLVDLLGVESVSIHLAEGESLPVSLPEGNVSVEVNNASAILVEFSEAQDVNVAKLVPAGQTVQVASAASSSASFSISGIEAFGVGVPYGTEGASLGIWVSIDDTNWFLLPEVLPFVADVSGTNYACNTAGVGLMELLAPWAYCKLQTLDAEGAAQVQAANRDFVVVTR